jgi:hypothetical protein
MGAEKKCPLYGNPEIISAARESSSATLTAPYLPGRGAKLYERPDA